MMWSRRTSFSDHSKVNSVVVCLKQIRRMRQEDCDLVDLVNFGHFLPHRGHLM
jgi:hypothetical protein